MSITIEQVKRQDIACCAALIRESFLTVAEQFGLTAENCPAHGAFLTDERLAAEFDAGVFLFMARADGAPAGFVALERKGDQACLEKLAVLPGDRHRGIGRALVSRALDCARANGAHKVSIGIIEENAVLRRWYEALGFRHIGTKRFDHLPFTVGFMGIELTPKAVASKGASE